MINFDLIQAKLYVGSCPYADDDIAKLKQLKVSALISLQSDVDLTARNIDWADLQSMYRASEILAERYPIHDFDEIDLGNKIIPPINSLHRLLTAGHNVYLHCNSGVCRAPAVVLGYLCHYEGMTLEAGLRQIRISRPIASPFQGAVKKALLELAA